MSQTENMNWPEGEEKPVNPEVDAQTQKGRTGLIELLYGVLFSPTVTFRRISQEPPLFYGFIVFVVVAVLTSIVYTLAPPDISNLPPELSGAVAGLRPLLGIAAALLGFISWFVLAGVLQLFAEILGGRGRAAGVLTVLALADIPRVLVIPFQLLAYFTANSFSGRFITVALSLILFFWRMALTVIGLREVHGFSTGRAIATLLIPWGFLFLVMIIFIIIIIGIVAPLAG